MKLFMQSGKVTTHAEETRKFFENSSVSCVLAPRPVINELKNSHYPLTEIEIVDSTIQYTVISFIIYIYTHTQNLPCLTIIIFSKKKKNYYNLCIVKFKSLLCYYSFKHYNNEFNVLNLNEVSTNNWKLKQINNFIIYILYIHISNSLVFIKIK